MCSNRNDQAGGHLVVLDSLIKVMCLLIGIEP